jgi:hypothetical protein
MGDDDRVPLAGGIGRQAHVCRIARDRLRRPAAAVDLAADRPAPDSAGGRPNPAGFSMPTIAAAAPRWTSHAIRRRDGKLSIEGGRPASTWAWAFAMDGELILSPESRDDEWRVPVADEAAADAAFRLTDLLHKQPGRDQHASLFVSFMPLNPTDRRCVEATAASA